MIDNNLEQHKYFGLKLFLSYIAFAIILVSAILVVHFYFKQNSTYEMIVLIVVVATLIAFIFSLIFSIPPKKIYKIAINQANELQNLAQNLDEKVELKTLEITTKDRLIQNQNKLAELGEMVGNIAHQWRHPLTCVSLILQNLNAYKAKNKMSSQMFETSMKNSLEQIDFMSQTIENFKNFYKQSNAKTNFCVTEALTDVLGVIGSVLEYQNIKIEVTDLLDAKIFHNKNEFSQVLMNLIINAKDAIYENNIKDGVISILLEQKHNIAKIQIKDNAKGINIDCINEIFDPFFTTKKEKGTGIGLHICKVIVEDNMRGTIDVSNDEYGAIFTIKLDLLKLFCDK